MARLFAAAAALAALAQTGEAAVLVSVNDHHHHHREHRDGDGHHKHHHHSGHHHHRAPAVSEKNATSPAAAAATPKSKVEAPAAAVVAPAKSAVAPPSAPKAAVQTEEQIMSTMKRLDKELSKEEKASKSKVEKAQIKVNGPLPQDFSLVFAKGVAEATGASPDDVRVVGTAAERGMANVDDVVFEAKPEVAKAVRDQAANPDSKLANGPLHVFLVAKDDDDDEEDDDEAVAAPASKDEAAPEIDSSAMPFGDLEPFGREDTAQELTESSIQESDAMVDQLERAEVAEEKRAVFRALTRLRGAAITSYDGIARSQTGNIDEYARKNQWRKQHPVRHLAQEESDTKRWAFPDSSDF